jgi:DNA modification methylase
MTTPDYQIYNGDCIEVLDDLANKSEQFDCVITDPPYPGIKRDYGTWTEDEWRSMMDRMISKARPLLKPRGSMAFVLQPNSRKIGTMRSWLWRFIADYSESWNLVQDLYWWNFTSIPTTHCSRKHGLCRNSVKPIVWLGPADCYRNQDEVLWEASDSLKSSRCEDRALQRFPGGQSVRRGRIATTHIERGGVTPFNLIPMRSDDRKGKKHGATTPPNLCDWLVRYLCPKGGRVLDPFAGSGTIGLSALDYGCSYIGIERLREYAEIAGGYLRKNRSL